MKAKEEKLTTNDPKINITDMKDGRTRLRVQFDITYKGSAGSKVEGESLTEPDMTLRLGQLLERHSRGRNIPMKEPLYFDTEIPTFSDMTDVERYRDQLQRRLEETQEFLKKEQLEKLEKQHQERMSNEKLNKIESEEKDQKDEK